MNFTLCIPHKVLVIQSPLTVSRKSWFRIFMLFLNFMDLTKAVRLWSSGIGQMNSPHHKMLSYRGSILMWFSDHTFPSSCFKLISTANTVKWSSLAGVHTYMVTMTSTYLYKSLNRNSTTKSLSAVGIVSWPFWEARISGYLAQKNLNMGAAKAPFRWAQWKINPLRGSWAE